MFSELLLAVCITRSVFPGWRTALDLFISCTLGWGWVGIQDCRLVPHVLYRVSWGFNSLSQSHFVTWFNFCLIFHPNCQCTLHYANVKCLDLILVMCGKGMRTTSMWFSSLQQCLNIIHLLMQLQTEAVLKARFPGCGIAYGVWTLMMPQLHCELKLLTFLYFHLLVLLSLSVFLIQCGFLAARILPLKSSTHWVSADHFQCLRQVRRQHFFLFPAVLAISFNI